MSNTFLRNSMPFSLVSVLAILVALSAVCTREVMGQDLARTSPSFALQTLMDRTYLKQQTNAAQTIAVGIVSAKRSHWTEANKEIVTDITLSVSEVIKGLPDSKEIVFRVPGGEVDGARMIVSHTPSFVVGERVIVFVGSDSQLVGWERGKYSVNDGMVFDRRVSLSAFVGYIQRILSSPEMTDSLVEEAPPPASNGTVLAPRINYITPNNGPAKARVANETALDNCATDSTTITIEGTGFGSTQGNGYVRFLYRDDIFRRACIISWSDATIRARVPGHISSGDVQVVTDQGVSNGMYFTVWYSYQGYKWQTNGTFLFVNYRINSNTEDTTGENQAVQNAAATWNTIPNISIELHYEGATGIAEVNQNDGVNAIFWRDLGALSPLGVTYAFFVDSRLTGFDMVFNDHLQWGADGGPRTMDVQNVATHELGHALGLGDLYGAADSEKTMYGWAGLIDLLWGETKKRTLEQDDIAGIRYMYNYSPPAYCAVGQYKAEYYNNKTLSGSPVLTRCENAPINYDWGGNGPGNGVGSDNFSVRWTGRFSFNAATYTFNARADDGIRAYIDGGELLNEWRPQPPTSFAQPRPMTAGEHEVRVEYYEEGGGATAQFNWQQGPTTVTCSSGQYKAEYYNNKTLSGVPVLTRCESAPINYDWGGGGPGNGVNNDNFSVRWTGRFSFNAATYTFNAHTDDGMRVYIDGGELLNEWRAQVETYIRSRPMTAGEHEVKVEYYEDAGGATAQFNWQQGSTTVTCSNGQYKAEYYNNKDLAGTPVFVQCENWPINHDWGNGGPGNGVGADNFSVRWTGRAHIAEGNYTFIARSDDGIRVWMNQNQIINAWYDQGAVQDHPAAGHVADGTYEFKIEYYENAGAASARFWWEQNANTSCPSGQYKAEYYNNKTLSGSPVFTRCENAPINYDWVSGSPGNGVNNDNFSVRWTGRFSFDAATYDFTAHTDDGMRVYIDGSELLNEWRAQVATYVRPRPMTAGEHEVKVEYYENDGWASAQFNWQSEDAIDPSCRGFVPPDYSVEYYNNASLSGSPTFTACGNWPIHADWGAGGPGHGIGNDNFSARYQGTAYFEAGAYTFTARGDDGFRVWIDNVQIMNEWRDQPPFTKPANHTVSTGSHDIKIEYYEKAGGALFNFDWTRATGCQGAALNFEQTASGTISNSSPSQNYCFTAASGTWASIRMFAIDGSSLDTIVELYRPDGSLLRRDDDGADVGRNSFLVAQLDQTGVWRLTATRFSDSTSGSYRLRMERGREAALGDLDRNCVVNEADRQQIVPYLGTRPGDPFDANWNRDLNLDSIVDAQDHSLLVARLNRSCSSAMAGQDKIKSTAPPGEDTSR